MTENEDQFFIRSDDDYVLVASYLAEEGFTESDGTFVRKTQVQDDLTGYRKNGFLNIKPNSSDLNTSLEDLAEQELVDERKVEEARDLYKNPAETCFYRLNDRGKEAYLEVEELSGIDELDHLYRG